MVAGSGTGSAARPGGAVRGGRECGADCVLPLVAGPLPLRPDGMSAARLHVPAGASAAHRRHACGADPGGLARRRAGCFADTSSMRRTAATSTSARLYSCASLHNERDDITHGVATHLDATTKRSALI